jgi:hypothetical protein
LLADRSQFPFQDAFPNHPPPDTLGEPLGLNNLIDTIWELRRKQERRFDPLPYLGDDVMHEVLLYVVSLWDLAESRAWGTPRNYISDPLVLTNVSRQWSKFITSSPQLWSYLLIDTDDEDVLEYLQLFLQLSCNRQLFIFLHGSAIVCDAIMVDLLEVGDRIGALVYPPNVSLSTLAMFQFYLGAAHDQLQQICQWYEVEAQSSTQPQQDMNRYSFPTSIQSLWMDGLFLLSNLVTLPHFQSLSSLSVRISVDSALPPAHTYRLEFPKLERLRVQMAAGFHHQAHTPILMICHNLKLLDLQYTLELEIESLEGRPAWMEFDRVDALEELQVDVTIHILTEVNSVYPLADEWLQGLQVMQVRLQQWLDREQQQWLDREQQLEQLKQHVLQGLQKQLRGLQELQKLEMLQVLELQEQELRELSKQELQRQLQRLQGLPKQEKEQILLQVMLQRELLQRERREQREQLRMEEMLELQLLEGERVKLQKEQVELELELELEPEMENYQQQQQRKQHLKEREQHLRFVMSVQQHWRQWLNLPDHLEHLQKSSLKVAVTTRMHEEASRHH